MRPGIRSAIVFICIAALAMAAACSKDPYAPTGSQDEQETAYYLQYSKLLSPVSQAMRSYKKTGDKPALCEVGSDMDACYETDGDTLKSIRRAVIGLQNMSSVPERFREGHTATLEGLQYLQVGIDERMRALHQGQPTSKTSEEQLRLADQVLSQASVAYPVDNPPPVYF